jgi:hypothetical protein
MEASGQERLSQRSNEERAREGKGGKENTGDERVGGWGGLVCSGK